MPPVIHFDASKDAALIRLHDALKARHAPKPGTFGALDDAQRREYFAQAQRRKRAAESVALAKGAIKATVPNIRTALADAALMLLATDGPGADQVRQVLAEVFSQRPGVPISVESMVRKGKIRPKLAGRKQ